MFHRPALVSLPLLLALACLARADAAFERQVVAPYVEVRTASGTGSGVVLQVGDELLVLTAHHVVAGCPNAVLVKRHDDDEMETRWAADVVWQGDCVDPSKPDLALLKPRTPLGLTPAKYCSQLVTERGEAAWVVGTHSGLHASLEQTVVNRPSMRIDGHKYLLVNGNEWYGNSGGPAFVKRGSDYFLAGICVRLAVLNPRTPVCCEGVAWVAPFLESYLSRPQHVAYRPAPAVDAKPDYSGHPLVGWWVLHWGGCSQHCRFDADGTYSCPKYGGKKWWPDPSNPDVVWFTESGSAVTGAPPCAYVLSCGFDGTPGCGWHTCKDSDSGRLEVSYRVEGVRLERVEPLPVMPSPQK